MPRAAPPTRSGARGHVPGAFVAAIAAGYARRGRDPAPALRAAGLDPAPERVPVDAFEAFSAHAMRELDDEALGWFSRRLPWGSYGMLLRASLTSPTLAVALARWARHHDLLTDDVGVALCVEGDTAALRVEERSRLGELRELCLVSLLRNVHGVACWLADSRIALIGARFPFPAPPHADAYARMFGGAIAFDAGSDAPVAELRFDAGYLGLPVVRDDAALRQVLQRPIRLMARQYRQDRQLSQRIAGFIAANAGQPPDAEAIAARFAISVRSLQRHLRDEGTSVAEITSRARRLRAEELLLRGNLPLKRVARLAGYTDESSFTRAFRRWTGTTPTDFRRNGAGAGG